MPRSPHRTPAASQRESHDQMVARLAKRWIQLDAEVVEPDANIVEMSKRVANKRDFKERFSPHEVLHPPGSRFHPDQLEHKSLFLQTFRSHRLDDLLGDA